MGDDTNDRSLVEGHNVLDEEDTNDRRENAWSIRTIPVEQLPDRAARAELIRRALAGQDVYAYVPAASDQFVVWVRQPHPALEGRFSPMEWARLWHAGLQPENLPVASGHSRDSDKKEQRLP